MLLIFFVTILILSIFSIYFISTIKIMRKCTATSQYVNVSDQQMINNVTVIKRLTKKMILNNQERIQLLQQSDFLVPSITNGTYCDINYSTYYTVPKDIYKEKKIKIRIRHYYYFPGLFFEIKSKNLKIRTEIDHNYQIITKDDEVEKHSSLLNELLQMLRLNQLPILCKTTYKRFSFVYYYDNRIRITLDNEIEYNNIKYNDLNLLEVKYPLDYENSDIITEIVNRCKELNINISDINKSNLPKFYHEN